MVQSDRRTKKHLVERFESVGDDKPVSSEHVTAYLDMSTAYSAYAKKLHGLKVKAVVMIIIFKTKTIYAHQFGD